jgi:hypothetical protein
MRSHSGCPVYASSLTGETHGSAVCHASLKHSHSRRVRELAVQRLLRGRRSRGLQVFEGGLVNESGTPVWHSDTVEVARPAPTKAHPRGQSSPESHHRRWSKRGTSHPFAHMPPLRVSVPVCPSGGPSSTSGAGERWRRATACFSSLAKVAWARCGSPSSWSPCAARWPPSSSRHGYEGSGGPLRERAPGPGADGPSCHRPASSMGAETPEGTKQSTPDHLGAEDRSAETGMPAVLGTRHGKPHGRTIALTPFVDG